jgi:hypothetical protein
MTDEFEFDLDGFNEDLKTTLANGRKAFTGKYKSELNALSGLSKEEVDTISPGITDLQKYDELITVVKEASRVNLEQALLKEQIIKLGGIAVTIAKRIPALTKILNA